MGEFLFDLYDLLVVNIFGSIFVSVIAVAAIIAVIFLVCRVRQGFMVIWLLFYLSAMTTMALGGLGLLIFFLISATSLVWQAIGWWSDRKQI